MDIQSIQSSDVLKHLGQTNMDNTRKSEIISEFEKMIMKMMLKPFENSLTSAVNESSHISLDVSLFLDNLSNDLSKTLNFGVEEYYK